MTSLLHIHRFHTNSASTATSSEERTCALCLNSMDNDNVKKICSSCMAKHNFSMNAVSKTQSQLCNLCQNSVDTEKFQDHLLEHEMENGIVSCAVCKSIFTSIVGLKEHIREHKLSALDLKEACSKCSSRFLYKSELSHHQRDHDSHDTQTKPIKTESDEPEKAVTEIKEEDDEDYIEIEKVAENSI